MEQTTGSFGVALVVGGVSCWYYTSLYTSALVKLMSKIMEIKLTIEVHTSSMNMPAFQVAYIPCIDGSGGGQRSGMLLHTHRLLLSTTVPLHLFADSLSFSCPWRAGRRANWREPSHNRQVMSVGQEEHDGGKADANMHMVCTRLH